MINLKHRVVLSYLRKISEEEVKRDKASQTKAVEALFKRLLKGPLSEYADKVYAVGGSVRDEILGKTPKDLDIVIVNDEKKMDAAKDFADALVDTLNIRSDRQPQVLNKDYGIYGVALFKRDKDGNRVPFLIDENTGNIVDKGGTDVSGYVVEMTPPRKEGPYPEGSRKPEYVEYASIKEDQERRDLTINSVYKNLATGKMIDRVGGLNDLKEKVLRPPEQTEEGRSVVDIYKEDPLRILRLVRFHGKMGDWETPKEVLDKIRDFIKNNKSYINDKISKERIVSEFMKVLTGNNAREGMERMRDLGILWLISPDLEKLIDTYHDTVYHKGESVWDHTMDVLSRSAATPKARMAALLHDIGKVGTLPDKDTGEEKPVKTTKIDSKGRDRVQFIGHEKASKRMAEKILKDLKMPNDIIKSVSKMVGEHMSLKNVKEQKQKKRLLKLREFIEKLYNDLEDAISLLKADMNVGDESEIDSLYRDMRELIEEDKKKGILKEKGGKIQYITPLNVPEAMNEYKELKGDMLKGVLNRLKKYLMEGRIEDQKSAKEHLDTIMRDKSLLEKITKEMSKNEI